jgi:hypothetical protein
MSSEMPKASDSRAYRRLQALIELALSEGWIACSDEDGLKLVKPGLPPIRIGAPLRCAATLADRRDQGERE